MDAWEWTKRNSLWLVGLGLMLSRLIRFREP